MELTPKALKEIDRLMLKIDDLQNETSYLNKKEVNKNLNKINRIKQNIDTINSTGISSKEFTALNKEVWGNEFTTILLDRSISSTSYIKIGFSKTLEIYIEAQCTKWSSSMSNAIGRSQLANRRELDIFKEIDQIAYNWIIAKGIKTITTRFGEIEEKEIKLTVGI